MANPQSKHEFVGRSLLGRAKGHGAARSGVGHWWMQRLTALGLIPLVVYCLVSFLTLADAELHTARAWLAAPFHAVMMLLLVAVGFYHGALGLQVVIEDYIAHETRRILLLAAMKMLMTAAAALALFSVLRVAFGAGG